MHVLRNLVDAVRPGGDVLDLQVVRPDAAVEHDGDVICAVEGEALLSKADAARAAIDALVQRDELIDVAVDDHDVFKHYASGADLVTDFADSIRSLPADLVPALEALAAPVVVREHCRLRKLRVVGTAGAL